MPKVNGKSYSYTTKGKAAAKKAAAKSGKKMKSMKK
jgi:butyrate kinase